MSKSHVTQAAVSMTTSSTPSGGYTRVDTKCAKGIAVLLMLIHHLYAFPQYLPGGSLRSLITAFGVPLPTILGEFGKICVSIFFFLGGYGMWFSANRGKSLNLIKKIKSLYITYWKYAIIFIAIGFVFFRNQGQYNENINLCITFDVFRWGDLIQNLLGISTSYNGAWWFFQSYIVALLMYPAFSPLFNRRSLASGVARVAAASILLSDVFPALGKLSALGKLASNPIYSIFLCQLAAPWVACFWLGSVFAEHNALVLLRDTLFESSVTRPARIAGSLTGLVIVVYLRQFWKSDSFDIFYVPVFLACLQVLFNALPPLQAPFLELGKLSTGIWLTHSFLIYRYGAVAKLIVAPRWSIPSLAALLILSVASVKLVDLFWSSVGKVNTRRQSREL